jgi:hypothetical protein
MTRVDREYAWVKNARKQGQGREGCRGVRIADRESRRANVIGFRVVIIGPCLCLRAGVQREAEEEAVGLLLLKGNEEQTTREGHLGF